MYSPHYPDLRAGIPDGEIHSRVDYLLERKRQGKFLYANFPSIRNIGIAPFKETEGLRPTLGDHEHAAATALRIFSSLYLSPLFAHEFYRLGKILGYSSVAGVLKTFNILPILEAVKKTSNGSLLEESRILELQRKGWSYAGGGLIESVDVASDLKSLTYTVKDGSCKIIRSSGQRFLHDPIESPCNCIEVGILCGQTEALLGGIWEGYEESCMAQGAESCRIVLNSYAPESSRERISALTKEEYSRILDKAIDLSLSKDKDSGRASGDGVLISLPQAINYLMLSKSKGHVVLSKWAGKKVGERIIRKEGCEGIFDTLDFFRSYFRDLGMGLLSYEACPDSIRVRVDESVYSSGVEGIKMKLCIFLAGILEGGLSEATRPREGFLDESDWLVSETRCTAVGDPFCEFECKHKDPDLLRRLVLG